MEKWQDLNWHEQSRAGNLLGGIIWAATQQEGKRGRDDHPAGLNHSLRCGGYPFTTPKKCYLGLAIAMTPRGEIGPENLWSNYGVLEIVDLPHLTEQRLAEYCRLLVPSYVAAYSLSPPSGAELQGIVASALSEWRSSDGASTREGVKSVTASLDVWRDSRA